jgi:hypothetical protein
MTRESGFVNSNVLITANELRITLSGRSAVEVSDRAARLILSDD